MPNYEQYKAEVTADIAATLKEKSCQPILFVGSGLSKRYCQAPNWPELLALLARRCPEIKYDVAYYLQSGITYPEIGTIYAKAYKEWAWGAGREVFPVNCFSADQSEEIFIKHAIARELAEIRPAEDGTLGDAMFDAEVTALKRINPHAVISTNYDQLLEPIFTDFEPIIGQQVVRHSHMSVGEVFKIHGCISVPSSLTLTSQDYAKFQNDKKYLSAKMFAFFVEHPLLFIGYSATDDNIRSILAEIDHMLPSGQGVVENIFLLEWKQDLTPEHYPAKEKVLDIGAGRNIRIKSITASSYEWVFQAFRSSEALERVNVKLLRSISHRVFDLVRRGTAQNGGQINFQMLSRALDNPEELATVYGMAALTNPALVNILYPYLPNEAAAAVEHGWNWQALYKAMDVLKAATGFAMRESDNRYHVHIPPIHRYSQEAVDLLTTFRAGGELPDLSDPAAVGEIVRPPAAGAA